MTSPAPTRLVAVRAARLFDGASGTLIADPCVVLDGTKIVEITSGTAAPEGATVVEFAGATLLPGLIDTHVHLCFDASDDVVARLAERDDEAVLTAMTAAARCAVRAGVTTVRDLGDRDYLSLQLRSRAATDPTLPTIVAAGPPLTTPNGHCHFLGGAASGLEGVRAAVRQRADRGVDVIKVMASGGQLTPGTHSERPQFSPADLRAVVEEAHRLGLPVTAHAHGTQPVLDALAAGVDGLEHASFLTTDGVDRPSDELLRELATLRVQLGLTLGIANVPGVAPPPDIVARIPALMENVRRIVASGALVVIGTDAGIAPIKPHDVLPLGVAQLADLGPSALAALTAATSIAAEVCRLGDRKGRLAPGYDADLVAVDGNPLEDLAALLRVRAVFVRGTRLAD
ncbi:amidohydrolase family protein [Microlunatus sp. GCM10028923]|uniref:amidohydrolase family protein n=1 Tax=Microlunatus sp. GCM10028923 TaxID=3273400 RepID=UPI00360D1AC8